MKQGVDYVTAGQDPDMALGWNATAEGMYVTASGDFSHAEGSYTVASNSNAHAEGNFSNASGSSAHAEGSSTQATGSYSHAEGSSTQATGHYSHAEGNETFAIGIASHAEGINSRAEGDYSHAQGPGTHATHRSQMSFGEYNVDDSSTAAATARGTYVEIVGNGTANSRSNARTLDWTGNEWLAGTLKIGGTSYANAKEVATKEYVDNHTPDLSNYMQKGVDYVTAGKKSGTTLGTQATAEGDITTASGEFSHAEGKSTTASAYASHAEGNYTTASGQYSHAEGGVTIASGRYSHAEGQGTTAQRQSQHTFGDFNVLDISGTVTTRGTFIEIVGNGTADNARSNARTLDWSGNERIAGSLTLGMDTANETTITATELAALKSLTGTYNTSSFELTMPFTINVVNS